MSVGEQMFVRLGLPDGLEELVEGVAREVLHSTARSEPEINIVARNYFDKLVTRRKQSKFANTSPLKELTSMNIIISIYIYIYIGMNSIHCM